MLTKINYDILVYLPNNIETVKGQKILTNDFEMGAYSIAIVENMNSKDLLTLQNDIKKVDGVNKVISIYDLIGTSIPIEMLPTEVRDKIHKDNVDLLFITFNDGTSAETTLKAVDSIREITKENVKLSGMSSMVLDNMNLSKKEILIYIVIAVLLCILVLELSLDSYLAPIFLLLNIGFAVLVNLGTNMFLGSISYITKALVAVLQLGVTTDFSIFLYHSYEDKKKEYKDRKKAMSAAIQETAETMAKVMTEAKMRMRNEFKEDRRNVTIDYSVDYKDDFEKFDLSIPIGLSYEFSDFIIDARYNLGLTKIIDDREILEDSNKAKNSVFMLTVGYKISF